MTDGDAASEAFDQHDHDRCRADAMAAARAACEARKLRLTPVRARALEILLEDHRAIGAYELLDRLRAEGLGSQPPVAYRALDFLLRHGFIHRIERLNAYVACAHPDTARGVKRDPAGPGHDAAFMICRSCGAVAETPSPAGRRDLDADARRLGFRIERVVIEAEGLCPACAAAAPGDESDSAGGP